MPKKIIKEDEENTIEPLTDSDFDVVDASYIDDKILALAEFLDDDPFNIEDKGYDEYLIIDGENEGKRYLVLLEDEISETLRVTMENYLYDLGFEGMRLNIEDWIEDDYCEDTMREAIENEVNEMNIYDVIDELLNNEVISLTDTDWFKLKEDIDLEDEYFDEDNVDNYDRVQNDYVYYQALIDYKEDDDLFQMFWDYGYGDGLLEETDWCLRNGGFPSYIDEEGVLDYLVGNADVGSELATYDGNEESVTYEGVDYYIYRR